MEGKHVIRRGRNAAGHQIYQCRHCRKTFTETKGGPSYRKHLDDLEIHKICRSFLGNNGIRGTGRLTNHHRDTVGRLICDLSSDPKAATRYLLMSMRFNRTEIEELGRIVSARGRGSYRAKKTGSWEQGVRK